MSRRSMVLRVTTDTTVSRVKDASGFGKRGFFLGCLIVVLCFTGYFSFSVHTVDLLFLETTQTASSTTTAHRYESSSFNTTDTSSNANIRTKEALRTTTTSASCPPFPSLRNATWDYSPTTSTWTWTPRQQQQHSPSFHATSYSSTSSVEQALLFMETSWSSSLLLTPNASKKISLGDDDVSVVLYGSSYTRALYHSLYRLAQAAPSNSALPEHVALVASGEKWRDLACDPNRTGFHGGKFGIDMETCGPPTIRRAPELGRNVVIGFKTYLHTPLAENLLLQILQEENLRHPNVLLVDVAIWGTRGEKTGALTEYVMEPEDELEYYMNWLNTTFPSTIIAAVVDTIQGKDRDLLQSRMVSALERAAEWEPHRWILFRKDHLLEERPKVKSFPCAHGCAGPITHVQALLFNEWLWKARSQGCFGRSTP